MFPTLQRTGEVGRPRSLLSGGAENREDRVPSFPAAGRSGKTVFPPLQRPEEQGRPRSLQFWALEEFESVAENLVDAGERRERRVPSSPVVGRAGKMAFPGLWRAGKLDAAAKLLGRYEG